MATTLDTKSLHVAKLFNGLREDLKRQLFTEIASVVPVLQTDLAPTSAGKLPVIDEDLRQNLAQVNNHYHTASWIPDRRFFFGRPLLKKLIYRLLNFYTARQTHFNLALVRIVNSLNEKLGYTFERTDQHAKEIRSLRASIEKLAAQVNTGVDFKLTNLEIMQRKLMAQAKLDIEARLEAALREASNTNNGLGGAPVGGLRHTDRAPARSTPSPDTLSHLSDSYFAFIDRFRGGEDEIKERLGAYLPYFKHAHNVLDIGCGRGEFLEMCHERGIGASGIDINEDMIFYCRRKGLSAQKVEALEHLNSLSDKSLDGIFISYVAEHMDALVLINVLSTAYRKLQYNSYLVVESINPTSLFALANNFYLDLLNIRPIHPQALDFLLESCGFRNRQVEYLLPVPPEMRLQMSGAGAGAGEPEGSHTALYNQNLDKLNELLFGHQAYAIIGRK